MAENKQGMQSKWLLLIAIVLGVVVVLIYNAHIYAIRSAQKAEKVGVAVVLRKLQAGEKINEKDIGEQEISREIANRLGDIVKYDERGTAWRKPLLYAADKGSFLKWSQINASQSTSPSDRIKKGCVGKPVVFSSDESLGDLLTIGAVVSLQGQFSVNGGRYEYYPIMKVRVLNIGGAGAADTLSGRFGRGMKNYRKMTIEVPEEVSLKLSNLFTHMVGDVKIDLCPQNSDPDITINEELLGLTKQARPNRTQTPTIPGA